jgi:hypothetical protein
MGERIPGARVVALPGDDHLPWEGDSDTLLGEIEQFVSGTRAEEESDRVLSTLLFTDIVGSTAEAARVGDSAWSDLLARHHRVVRAGLARFHGKEVDGAGDGAFATFDGPPRAVRCAVAIRRAGPRPGPRDPSRRPHRRDRAVERRCPRDRGAHQRPDRPGRRSRRGARSSTVKDIVAGSGIEFAERGDHELAGVPGTWRLFAATA